MTRHLLCAAAGAMTLLAGCSTPGALIGANFESGCASLAGITIAASGIGLPSGKAVVDSAALMTPTA
ncbi:MAG: tannase/feruloyl esterase family alpha/beta hydrolase, partial [Burkholderiaceae bacterium]